MSSTLEILANLITTLSIIAAGRNSVHVWWTGIVGCSIFALVFYSTNLYADVVLQLFFVGASVVGWRQWLKGDHGKPLHVTHAGRGALTWIVPVGVLATAGYGVLLHHYTNAYAPFLDSAILVFSVIAQLLMMQRRIETWPFWLLVNSLAVPVYFSRGLTLTSVLYAGYWVNAIVSWRHWRKLADEQATASLAEAAA